MSKNSSAMIPSGLDAFKKAKKIWGVILRGALILLILGNLGAGSMKMEEEIQVTGRVYVMGNEPFTHLGIELDNGEVYALVGGHDKELRGLQGKRLTVKGNVSGKTTRGADAIKVSSFKIAESK